MENKKLNIGLFIDTFFPMIDGVIMVVDNYAKQLSKYANVTVFCPQPKKKGYEDNFDYKVVRCKRLTIVGLDYVMPTPSLDNNFKKAIKDANLDIIHIHSPFGIGKMAMKYGKKHNIPTIITLHSQFKRDFKKATKSSTIANMLLYTIMKVFNGCDKVLTMNEKSKDLCIEYGCKRPIELIPNGTDMSYPENAEEIKQETREQFKLKEDVPTLLFVGRLVKVKNVDFLIDVANELKKKQFNYKLLIVGSGADEETFKKKVESLRLKTQVSFTGKISNRKTLGAIYLTSDLFVFPSFYDTDGIVRIEAGVYKTPTMFIEGSIASSTIDRDVNGYVGANDASKFADKIINIFSHPRKLKEVSQNAYDTLGITWEKVGEMVYEKYLQEIKDFKAKTKSKQ